VLEDGQMIARTPTGYLLAGGLAGVLGAILIAAYHGSWVPLDIYTFVLAIITLAATFIAPETQGRDLTRIQDALVDTRAGVAVER
jgi:MFS transporter, MHS family, metabolite:H+ symporter